MKLLKLVPLSLAALWVIVPAISFAGHHEAGETVVHENADDVVWAIWRPRHRRRGRGRSRCG